MPTQIIDESTGATDAAPRPVAPQLERLDRLIEAAQSRLAEQETHVREVALVSGGTAVASFELQKMHLLIALLREGRERMTEGIGE